MITISDTFEQIAAGCEFYAAEQEEKIEMIAVAPAKHSILKEYGAFLAATVHKLANDFNLEVPRWTFNEEYYIRDEPFFDCNAKGKLRLLFMYKSPAEFKHRNLFVDENILVRA